MTIEQNSFLIFEIGLRRMTYITLIKYDEYDDMVEMFDSTDLRAQTKYTGPDDWIHSLYEDIRDELDKIEADEYHGFPIYRIGDIHKVWSILKARISEINNSANAFL